MKSRVLAEVLLLVTATVGTAAGQEARPKVTVDPRIRDRLPEMLKEPLPEITTVRVPISGGNPLIRDVPPMEPPPPLEASQAEALARASRFRAVPPATRPGRVERPAEFILSPRSPHLQNAGFIALFGACSYRSESRRDYNDGFGWASMGYGSVTLSLFMEAGHQYLVEFGLGPYSSALPGAAPDPAREYQVVTDAGSQTLSFDSEDHRIVLLTEPAAASGWGVIRVEAGELVELGCREATSSLGGYLSPIGAGYLGNWVFYRVTVRRLE